jgi:hypothetical protein
MAQGRDAGEQPRLDVLAGDEQVHLLVAAVLRGRDEVLPLRDEQPELVPPAPVVQLPDELELLVVR